MGVALPELELPEPLLPELPLELLPLEPLPLEDELPPDELLPPEEDVSPPEEELPPLEDELPLEVLLLEPLLPDELEVPEFAKADVAVSGVVVAVVVAAAVLAASEPDVPPQPVSAIVAALLISIVQARLFAPIPRLAFPMQPPKQDSETGQGPDEVLLRRLHEHPAQLQLADSRDGATIPATPLSWASCR